MKESKDNGFAGKAKSFIYNIGYDFFSVASLVSKTDLYVEKGWEGRRKSKVLQFYFLIFNTL